MARTPFAPPPLRLSVPALSARLSPGQLSSTLARLVASGAAFTQADLIRTTGLARTTVTAALDSMVSAGVIRRLGAVPGVGRGRPAERLGLDPSFGVVAVADVDTHGAHLSVHDVGQATLADRRLPLAMADGPERVLGQLSGALGQLLQDVTARSGPPLRVAVIGLPGPVNVRRGVPVRALIMPGWDDVPIGDLLGPALGCPVLVENDANLCALGEARALPPGQGPLLYVKVGTGIGGGLVTAAGDLHHGADGAAGDIGHVSVRAAGEQPCACGNRGCVEAVASGGALARRFREIRRFRETRRVEGPAADPGPDELVTALRAGDGDATRLVREAGLRVGEVVADLVQFFNPARVVVGGAVALAGDEILTGVRTVVYRRALPLGARDLVITRPALDDRSGTAGGLVLGIEHTLVEEVLQDRRDRRN